MSPDRWTATRDRYRKSDPTFLERAERFFEEHPFAQLVMSFGVVCVAVIGVFSAIGVA